MATKRISELKAGDVIVAGAKVLGRSFRHDQYPTEYRYVPVRTTEGDTAVWMFRHDEIIGVTR